MTKFRKKLESTLFCPPISSLVGINLLRPPGARAMFVKKNLLYSNIQFVKSTGGGHNRIEPKIVLEILLSRKLISLAISRFLLSSDCVLVLTGFCFQNSA